MAYSQMRPLLYLSLGTVTEVTAPDQTRSLYAGWHS